ncbi:cadherin-23-like [Liolophura sinensis]|uniref:cadherin-23-like n=1 Tax=Liolophura sinensis TaxID=3198878 RepID=UPI00315946BD
MQIAHWLGMIVSFMLVGRCVSQDLDAPQFSQSFYEITVAENIKIGLTLFTVSITNKDPGDIKFTLNDTTNFIITRSGAVEYYGGLDYEKPELRQITLIITATDSGSPPKSTSVPVYINLTNINDESPRCVKQMYQGEVLNGAPAGTEVLQVLAVDRDFNTTLIYNLTLPNAYFKINRQTGVITTSRVVDIAAILEGKFETFRVRVSDGLRNNLCPVMLTIKDPNFHDPKFSKTVYESSLDEGSPAQRVSVLTVTATDEDIGAQKILTYSLTPTMYSDNFEIDSSSGEIWLMGSIDRENMTSPTTVTLIVEAVDSGLPPATASATVNIVINDVDDNGPKFSTDYYEFNMLKKFSRDLKITSLPKAVDADLGSNGV